MKQRKALPSAYILLSLLIMYLPIAIVIIFSFNNSRSSTSSVWKGFTLNWYSALFNDASMLDALRNSLILAIVSALLAAVIGTLGAYAMVSYKIKAGKTMEYLSTLPIMLPEIILGMVFLAFFSLVKLPFGMLTLIIAHTAFCIPYIYLLVKARLSGMSKSYEEAARDLGASGFRAFIDIILPMIAPAIASGMLLAFAMSFDDVIISVFVTGVNVNTLPIKIYTQVKTGVTPKTNALCAILFVFTVILGIISAKLSSPKKHRSP